VSSCLLFGCDGVEGSGRFRVRVTGSSGNPLTGVEACWRTGANGERYAITGEDGYVEVPEGAVRFSLRGYRVVRVSYPGGPEALVLRPGIRCVFALPEDLPLPRPPFRLGARLRHEDSVRTEDLEFGTGYADRSETSRDPGTVFPTFFPAENGRRLSLLVPGPGEVEVAWVVVLRSKLASGVEVERQAEWGVERFRVEEREGEQRFPVSLEAERLQGAMRELR
jgi:hypothetical protein